MAAVAWPYKDLGVIEPVSILKPEPEPSIVEPDFVTISQTDFVPISQTRFCHNFSNRILSQFLTILVHAEPSIVKEDFRSPSELTRPGLNTFSRSESTTPQILNCLKFPQKRDLPSGAIYHPYHLVVM